MAVPYMKIMAEVALRINAIDGPIAATLETNYAKDTQVAGDYVSTIFTFTSIQDAILNAEESLAWAVANVAEQPLRQYMTNETASLPSPSVMPSESADSKPIIGVWGAVKDADSGTTYSEMPLDIVRRRAASTLVCPVYWFALTGGNIEHTGTNVVVECCTYSRSDQEAAFTAGNIVLSDALEQAYVCGALSMLVRDDEFIQQAAVFSGYFQNALQAITSGLTTTQGVTVAA